MGNESAAVVTLPATPLGPLNADREAFELELRKAKLLAASTLVPPQYQDNVANCFIALNMAKRIGADPLQVCQNLYIVQGKPGWSGQFLIATFNQCGRFSAIRYEWRGEATQEKDRGCRAYATEKATGDVIRGPWVTWKMVEAEGWAKKSGSKWLTMEALMFQYRSAAFLVRTHAPEIAMGLQTVEELRDVIELDTEPAPTKAAALAKVLREQLAPVEPPPPEDERPSLELDGVVMPQATYPEVRVMIEKAKQAKDPDALDLAVSLIASLPEQFRAELRELAK